MIKKIKKKSKKQQKIDKNNIYFVIVIIIIAMILFGTSYYSKYKIHKEINKDNYNSFNFFYDKGNQLWFTEIQILNTPYVIPFHNHPQDLEDIIVEENIENIILLNRPSNIIITVPDNSSSKIAIAAIEISKLTGEKFKVLNIPTTSALNNFVEGFPYATCNNANDKTVVITFKKSNKNLISSKDRCIILEYKNINESLRVADALAYRLIKIM